MKAVLSVKNGYLNIDNGIKICKRKEDATVLSLSNAWIKKEEVYQENPMIGRIKTEVIDG